MLSDKIDEEFFERAGPSLKVLSTTSVGFEHVDLHALYRRKVRLGYTPDVLTDAVADVSVMLALMAGRNAGSGVTLVKEGKWPNFNFAPFFFTGPQLSTASFTPTRTVGFLGFGRIAQVTLARLTSFGITHCIYSSNPSSPRDAELELSLAARHGLRSVRRVELDELARESDILFVLAPGGDKTHHIINRDFLRKMKKHAVLVNTARGTLVDSDALAQALREEWIWGAGLDVVEGEPQVGADHPLVKEPRCVVVPHIGSATFETRLGMVNLAARNALTGIDDETMPAELDVAARILPQP
ncbi:D-isomer specific 2-hydroxyacid dehydrogenase [Lactifluus volemus]|nr:D-isomer specific 2-hydroxyacid dehydrogenase [Lactifluus volemus]